MKFHKADMEVIYELIRWFRNVFEQCDGCRGYFPREKMYYYDVDDFYARVDSLNGKVHLKRLYCQNCINVKKKTCESLKKIKPLER